MLQNNPNWGAFSPACLGHGYLIIQSAYRSNNFQVPMNSGNTLESAIKNWMNGVKVEGLGYNYID